MDNSSLSQAMPEQLVAQQAQETIHSTDPRRYLPRPKIGGFSIMAENKTLHPFKVTIATLDGKAQFMFVVPNGDVKGYCE